MKPEDMSVKQAIPIKILVMKSDENQVYDVIAIIHQQPDMLLVGQVSTSLELLMTIDEEIDVLVMSAREAYPPPSICSHLFGEWPDLKILVLAENDGPAVMYWRGVKQKKLGGISFSA